MQLPNCAELLNLNGALALPQGTVDNLTASVPVPLAMSSLCGRAAFATSGRPCYGRTQ